MRSGTENTPGIVGFGKAAEMGMADFAGRTEAMKKARTRLLEGLLAEIPDIRINSPQDETASPSVLNVSFLGTRGEVLLHTLEQEGIFVSTGSACSSNKKGRSHVLTAMGLSASEIDTAVRISLSRETTEDEIDACINAIKTEVQTLRKKG